MAGGTALVGRRRTELDEGLGSGSGGGSQVKPGNTRDGYGQLLGPPPELKLPAAPLRNNPLIRKRVVPAVNAVVHGFHGNACK